jgi:hypothetical protein
MSDVVQTIRGGAVLAATCAFLLSPSVTAAQALSTSEMTALSAPTADRVVRRDLLSILSPISRQLSSGMRLRLNGADISARPYGTRFPGLCRLDTLTLKYAPVEADRRPRDQPLQPYGFEASARYRAVSVPEQPTQGDLAESYVWNPACDRLPGDEIADWFSATDDEEAARALNFFGAAIDALRARQIEPACDLPPAEQRACRDVVLSESEIGKVFSVDRCAADAGFSCYQIVTAGFLQLQITGTFVSGDSLAPAAVTSIKVGYEVVVT